MTAPIWAARTTTCFDRVLLDIPGMRVWSSRGHVTPESWRFLVTLVFSTPSMDSRALPPLPGKHSEMSAVTTVNGESRELELDASDWDAGRQRLALAAETTPALPGTGMTLRLTWVRRQVDLTARWTPADVAAAHAASHACRSLLVGETQPPR